MTIEDKKTPKCGKKGFVFTLDALFAVTIAITVISATFVMVSDAQKDYTNQLQINQIAIDTLIVLDELGILQSHNKTKIKEGMMQVMPYNYGAKMMVFPYECVDEECTGFAYSTEVPPYEVVKGLETPVDLMLLIDRSSSMADDCPWWAWWCTGGIEDAKSASKVVLEYLYFQKDLAGLASFGSGATLDQGLTSDKSTVVAAIDAIDATYWPIQQTAIGDGIDIVNQEFTNNGRPEAEWITILLSDGQNNEGQDPLDAAQVAADENITIYTIGLGSDADEDTLGQIAGMTGGTYYYAPSSDDLEAIYNEIAMDIFRVSYDIVAAKRSFLTFDNNRTKYYNIVEMTVWLI
jgi:hypothetical protein